MPSWSERHQDDHLAMMTPRHRGVYFGLAGLTVALRYLALSDALDATLVFLLLGLVLPLARAKHLAIVALVSCVAVESENFLRYAAGVAVALILDRAVRGALARRAGG
jgi:hypothetical protein